MKTRKLAIAHARRLLSLPENHLAYRADVVLSRNATGNWLVFLRFK